MSRRAFTMIELLVVIAVLLILGAILFPVISKALDTARRTKCGANLTNLYKAFSLKKKDEITNSSFDMNSTNWASRLFSTYLNSERGTFRCPVDKAPFTTGGGLAIRCSYGMSDCDSTEVWNKSRVLFMEYSAASIPAAAPGSAWPPNPPFARHRKKCCVIMGDGVHQVFAPASIDPFPADTRTTYWTP